MQVPLRLAGAHLPLCICMPRKVNKDNLPMVMILTTVVEVAAMMPTLSLARTLALEIAAACSDPFRRLLIPATVARDRVNVEWPTCPEDQFIHFLSRMFDEVAATVVPSLRRQTTVVWPRLLSIDVIILDRVTVALEVWGRATVAYLPEMVLASVADTTTLQNIVGCYNGWTMDEQSDALPASQWIRCMSQHPGGHLRFREGKVVWMLFMILSSKRGNSVHNVVVPLLLLLRTAGELRREPRSLMYIPTRRVGLQVPGRRVQWNILQLTRWQLVDLIATVAMVVVVCTTVVQTQLQPTFPVLQ